jgi:hypothetical protein
LNVVGAVGDRPRPERILRRAQLDELDLLDPAVGVAPLPADESDALVGLEVDDRVRLARQQLRRPGHAGGGRADGDHVSTFTTK